MHDSDGVGTSFIWMTHEFLSRLSVDNSTIASGILMGSINDTWTLCRSRWTNAASHLLHWKCWQVTQQTGDPRASQQYKTLKHEVSMSWRQNVICVNLVPLATFGGWSAHNEFSLQRWDPSDRQLSAWLAQVSWLRQINQIIAQQLLCLALSTWVWTQCLPVLRQLDVIDTSTRTVSISHCICVKLVVYCTAKRNSRFPFVALTQNCWKYFCKIYV